MTDPNFPKGLNITPFNLPLNADSVDKEEQAEAIQKYGIAGRVWEAGQALMEYFTPGADLDPACTIFGSGPHRILELGSGQALPTLHLASFLSSDDLLILTDLPNVIPLCQRSVERRLKCEEQSRVIIEPLAWGEDISHLQHYGPWTHVVMCDLVYFPHLYPSLLHTLLRLTEPDETHETEVILSYQSRSLALEESFFDALGLYFELTPVRGKEWEAKIFICRRWKVTEEWQIPGLGGVMRGGQGVMRGRGFGLIDDLLGAIQWEV